ncbi:hypothetical protein [Acinetobacter sp.]|uniref:hypothetical protein n=1 Tax=Acinetobacter sp. TaxID=472 RepID=UPI0035ADDE4D
MFNKITSMFKSSKPTEEQLYREAHQLEFTEDQGIVIEGVLLNKEHASRLEYLSNRRVDSFDDLKALYNASMIMNEKIDLEIANQRFAAHVGNTEENLLQLKRFLKILTEYYRQFMRERR